MQNAPWIKGILWALGLLLFGVVGFVLLSHRPQEQVEPLVSVASSSTPTSTASNMSASPAPAAPPLPSEMGMPMREDRIQIQRSLMENNPVLKAQREAQRERILRLQPTQEQLAAMSTQDIVRELSTSVLTIEIFASSPQDGGLKTYREVHMGVSELLKRADATSALLAEYRAMIARIATPPEVPVAAGGFALSFPVVELLLSADEVMAQLPERGQRLDVISTILDSVDKRDEFDASRRRPLYGKSTREWTGTTLGKYLEALGSREYAEWKRSQLQGESGFLSHLMSGPEGDQIVTIARKYLENSQAS